MKLLLLTLKNSGKKIRINTSHIESYVEPCIDGFKGGSIINVQGTGEELYHVKETPKEIDEIILSFGDGSEIRKL